MLLGKTLLCHNIYSKMFFFVKESKFLSLFFILLCKPQISAFLFNSMGEEIQCPGCDL